MKSVALTIVFIWSFAAVAQDTLLHQNFNSGMPAATWNVFNEDGLTPNTSVAFVTDAWVIAEDTDSLGIMDSCAVSTSWYDPTGQSDDWLVLPAITLGNNNYLEWEAKSEDPSFGEDYEIWISSTGATPTDFLADSLYYQVENESPFWTTHKINLDTFATQTVNIAFRNVSDDNYLLFLDNITITENDPLSSTDLTVLDLSLYPNPANDIVSVQSSELIEEYYIYSMEGRLIHHDKIVSNTLDISAIQNGMYLLIFKAGTTAVTERLLIAR